MTQSFLDFVDIKTGKKSPPKPKSFIDFIDQKATGIQPQVQQDELVSQVPDIATSQRMEAVEKSAAGQAKPELGQAVLQNVGELLTGFGSEALLGLPERTGLAKRPAKQHWTQDLSYGVGKFVGFAAGLPVKLGSMGTRLLTKPAGKVAAKIAPKLAETKIIGRVLGNVAQKATALGLASAVSDIADVKGIPQRLAGGAVFGTIFGVSNLANFPNKAPLLNQIIRNTLSRGLGAGAGMYDPKIVKQIHEGITTGKVTPDIAQSAFDELLFTWFSRKPTTHKELLFELEKINKEVDASGIKIQKWQPQNISETILDVSKQYYPKSGESVSKNPPVDPKKYNEYIKLGYDSPTAMKKASLPEISKSLDAPNFIVTGSGEAIPIKLFESQPKIEDLLKFSRQPDIKPIPKLEAVEKPPQEPQKTTIQTFDKELKPQKPTTFKTPLKQVEVEPGKPLRPVEQPETTEKLTEKDYNEYNIGLNIPRELKKLDDYLYKKHSTKLPLNEKNAIIKETTDAVKETIGKERTAFPGFKVISNFARMGKGGEGLAKSSLDYIKTRSQWEQVELFKLAEARGLMRKEQPLGERISKPIQTVRDIGPQMYNIMEGKVSPKTPAEKKAFSILSSIREVTARRARGLDIKVKTLTGEKDFTEIKDYAPRIYEEKGLREFLESDKFSHFRDKYFEKIAKANFPERYANESTRAKAIEEAKNYAELTWAELKSRPSSHIERSRILDEQALKDLEVEWNKEYPNKKFPLQRDTSYQSLVKWIVGTNERLAWIETFGKDTRIGDRWIPENVIAPRNAMGKRANREFVDRFFSKYLGGMAPMSTKATRLLHNIRLAQMGKLAFAFLPNSLQWFTNTVPLLDFKSTGKAVWDVLKYSGVAGKEIKQKQREFFARSGATTFRQAFSLSMMENPARVSALADIFLKTHFFSSTEFFNALFSASGGARKVVRLSEKLYKKGERSWRSPFYKEELAKLGINEQRLKTIIKEGPLTEKDVFDLADAGFLMRRNTQFLADAFHLPLSWSGPVGKVLTQFKNFAYNQSSMLYNEPIKEAGKFIASGGRKGDITKLLKAVPALAIAGALVTKAKEELYPKLGIHFYTELMAGKSFPMRMIAYVLNSGGLGIAADVVMAASYGKSGMTSLVGGPTASALLDFSEALFNTFNEIGVAIDNTNAKYVKHRAKTILAYWQKFAERVSPDARIAIQNFFKDYKNLKESTNWTGVVTKAYRKYKELYKMKSPDVADEFWNAFMQTQGKEYQEIFKKVPSKPTPAEIENWWKEQGKHPGERVTTPGKSPGTISPEYWY